MKATLSGRVSVHGEPATSAVVELHNATGDVVTQSQVDERGSYLFHVSEGTWAVRAWDRYGHRGWAQTTLKENEEKRLDLDLEEG